MSAAAMTPIFQDRYNRKLEEFRQRHAPAPDLPRPDWAWLALASCHTCKGSGVRMRGAKNPVTRRIDWRLDACHCVNRAVFRQCLRRLREIRVMQGAARSTASWVYASRRAARGRNGYIWGRLNEEFVADFFLIARRELSTLDWRVFKLHMLDGGDWHVCTRILGIDRGLFFHKVYQIEQKLGRIYRDLQPYGLWPIDQYFS
jgi:hypothetical protein